MKLIDIIISANKNLGRNKARTFLTILAIFIGSFSIITTLAMNAGVDKFINDQVSSYGGDGMLQVSATDMSAMSVNMMGMDAGEPKEYGKSSDSTFTAVTSDQIEKVKKIDGVKADSLVVYHQVSADYAMSDKSDKKYIISSQPLPPGEIHITTTTGRNVDNTSSECEVLLPSAYVKYYGFENDDDAIGKNLTFYIINKATNTTKTIKGKIVGIQAPGVITQTTVYLNTALDTAIYNAYVEDLPAGYQEEAKKVYMFGIEYDYKNYNIDDIRKQFEDIGLSVTTVTDLVGQIRSFFDAITIVFTIFGAIALAAAAIGIINTLLMSVEERTREIGLDKALGMSSQKVFLSFSFEAILLGFWGSLFGTVVSAVIGKIVNTMLHSSGGMLESLPTFNLLAYTYQNVIFVIVIIMIIAFVAGTAPAIKAAKKNPIEALRYE